MKLLFKQRFFTWFDSYDVYNQAGEAVYTVDGKLAWGHRLEIHDQSSRLLGVVQQELLTFFPKFYLTIDEVEVGKIVKEFSFFVPVFNLTCNDWVITGDYMEWNYQVVDSAGNQIMTVNKELFNLTDTYVLNITDPQHALLCLMIVLAIDAAKCSSK